MEKATTQVPLIGLARKQSSDQVVLTLNYLLPHPIPDEAPASSLSPSDLPSQVLLLKTTKAVIVC